MKLAIVILNYNTYKLTIDLVRSIKNLSLPFEYGLIVIDNGSTNDSRAKLLSASKTEGFVFLANEKNLGYAAGNNVGLRYSVENGFDYVLVSNNDIEVESSEQIEKMIALMENKENIGAVSPRIVNKDGKKDPPIYYAKPSFWNYSFGIIGFNKKRLKFNENINCKIYAPRGSFMLLRSDALKAVDFLDENTFLYYEEPILAERMDKKGYECWHCGETYVIHNHGATINETNNKKTIFAMLSKSQRYYLSAYRKFGPIKIWFCLLFRKMIFFRR